MDFDVTDRDMDGYHRLKQPKIKGMPAFIVACFVKREKKHDFMQERKAKGPLYTKELGYTGENKQVFVNDHLTAYNGKLLAQAMAMRKQGHMEAAWTNRGKNFVKKTAESKPIQVKDNWSLYDTCKARK
ncbi:hypothetical protein PR048_018807 [Dryococelus australis]|uniref:PiggyBac transposable element-derived protein domain-containing protein n=1 Tax=Dryococelus australis TaxID=614101 RepID=A0ABQ9H1T7_9NEOP|nr:hypothetical protein PR048_018807 [Dryococelus australis]